MNAPAVLRIAHQYLDLGRNLEEDILAHVAFGGYVISEPEVFALGRPVQVSAPDALLLDFSHRFEDPDGWFIWQAAVNPGVSAAAYFASKVPYPLPFVTFWRHGRPRRRIYSFNNLEEKLWAAPAARPAHPHPAI